MLCVRVNDAKVLVIRVKVKDKVRPHCHAGQSDESGVRMRRWRRWTLDRRTLDRRFRHQL